VSGRTRCRGYTPTSTASNVLTFRRLPRAFAVLYVLKVTHVTAQQANKMNRPTIRIELLLSSSSGVVVVVVSLECLNIDTGIAVGAFVGALVLGDGVGAIVGAKVGDGDGAFVGARVGDFVGMFVTVALATFSLSTVEKSASKPSVPAVAASPQRC